MLHLVVSGPATVKPVAPFGQAERVQPIVPLSLLAPDHVAMAIGQDGWQGGVLDPGAQQDGAALDPGVGIVVNGAIEAEGGQARQDRPRQIIMQHRLRVGVLAFAAIAEQIGQIGLQPSGLEIAGGLFDDGITGPVVKGHASIDASGWSDAPVSDRQTMRFIRADQSLDRRLCRAKQSDIIARLPIRSP